MKLRLFDGERLVYQYQPGGKGEWGEIVYTFANKAAMVTKKAGNSDFRHDNHAVLKVQECAEGKEFPRGFTQAWG